ncbi:recombinase family protein [Azospirillum sp. TSO5]|uniref:recombinase family protein n=1 Tax=Azospirillum sp. TSO5 TaxID=716760 RepID=UPI000D618DF3|nr:recombinase family protein [Azospirillum sp. TSO5]PWC98060.1 resolvase [Azospirillum sp. TSO5]
MAIGKFVSYLRVSTDKQGRSGLGLQAQRAAVANYLNGGDWTLVQEFVEVESGGKNDRPVLAAAMAACRIHRATLVIAKLDRLSRNAAFLLTLRDSGVDFVAADMPDANRLTVGVMALVAEQEREAISARTKAALAQAKAQGKKLGAPNPTANITPEDRARGGQAGRAKRTEIADARAKDLKPVVEKIVTDGAETPYAVAKALNEAGVPTPSGGKWHTAQAQRLLARLGVSGKGE